MPRCGVCVDVSSDYVVCECVKVLEGVCDVCVFCCVVWVGGLSGWYVDVGDVQMFVLC